MVITFYVEFHVDYYFERYMKQKYEFQFSNHAKRRYRVRGEPNRSEKWILHEILHRYSNAVFLSIPSYHFRRVSHTTHARDHLVGGVKKNAAIYPKNTGSETQAKENQRTAFQETQLERE